MKSTYSKQTNTIKELPEMAKPNKIDYPALSMHVYGVNLEEYDNHMASLKEYQCHETAKTTWVHGQVVEEGVDYKIENSSPCGDDDCHSDKCCLCIAFPIPKQTIEGKGEDGLWNEVEKLYDRFKDSSYTTFIKELKSKFTIKIK